MWKRNIDIILALLGAIILALPAMVIALSIKATSPGPIFYWSRRVGRDEEMFSMPKFRTMLISTPEVATDKLEFPDNYLTPVGRMLRRFSLDEIPQLISVLRGDMAIVGPRPALHSQTKLIQSRRTLGINRLRPGITGWAQINGRDEIEQAEKIRLDSEYLQKSSIFLDMKIILLTVRSVCRAEGITH